MYLNEKEIERYNPLKSIINILPEGNIELTTNWFREIATHLAKGGVYCENSKDVVRCLHILQEIGLINFTHNLLDFKYYIEKKYGN